MRGERILNAGICAGLEPVAAAVLAASVQALAARAHPGPIPPQELAAALPGVIAAFGDAGAPAELA